MLPAVQIVHLVMSVKFPRVNLVILLYNHVHTKGRPEVSGSTLSKVMILV